MARNKTLRTSLLIAAIVPLLLLMSGCKTTRTVSTIQPQRGSIEASFTQTGKTRLADTYVISMLITGRISRIDLKPGDTIKKGDSIAKFDTLVLEQDVMETKARIEELQAAIAQNEDTSLEETELKKAQAALNAKEDSLKAADARVQAAQAIVARAKTEVERVTSLYERGAAPKSDLDSALTEYDTAIAQLREQEFSRSSLSSSIAEAKLEPELIKKTIEKKKFEKAILEKSLLQIEAQLTTKKHNLGLAILESPIDGVVLERYEQGDAYFERGTPLVLIGNLEQLEVESEVLTSDVLKLKQGTEVRLTVPAHPFVYQGTVDRIEPAGFTKVSSLGVEQQRVLVLINYKKDGPALGLGYSVNAKFITSEKSDALIIPRFSVLEDEYGELYVYKVVNGLLEKQTITLGIRNDLSVEVLTGLTDSDNIVNAPSSAYNPGDPVEVVK